MTELKKYISGRVEELNKIIAFKKHRGEDYTFLSGQIRAYEDILHAIRARKAVMGNILNELERIESDMQKKKSTED